MTGHQAKPGRLAAWTVEAEGRLGLREEHRLTNEFAAEGNALVDYFRLLAESKMVKDR